MTTFELSPQIDCEQTELPLMSSAEDSPVKTFQAPATRPDWKERAAAYSPKSFAWLASYDPSSSSWRTSQLSLVATVGDGSEEFLGTWPRSGLMCSGTAYQLPTLAHYIPETVSGSSLIPTPTACDYKGSGRPRAERGPKNNLRDWFKWHFGLQYPPVTAVEYMNGYPTDHTALRPLETQSSLKFLK